MAIRSYPPQTKHRMRDVAPLDTPYSINISVTEYCNLNCNFCPYHGLAHRLSEKGTMPLDFYKRFIDQLDEFPGRIRRFQFAGAGEPTLHPNLLEMIAYAKEKDVADEVMLTTNGLLLNPEYNLKLIETGLDLLRISVPAIDNETAYEITGHKIDVTEPYIENIRHIFQHKTNMTILCKATNFALGGKGGGETNPELEEKFYSMYDDICDYCVVEAIAPWAGTDDESLKKQGLSSLPEVTLLGKQRESKRFCEVIFYYVYIDSQGNVYPCQCSPADTPVIGKIGGPESLMEIWNSKRYLNLRIANLEEKLSYCKVCGGNNFIETQNIDEDRDIIYKRLKEKLKQA